MKTDKDQGFLQLVDDPAKVDILEPDYTGKIYKNVREENDMMVDLIRALIARQEGFIVDPIRQIWKRRFEQLVDELIDANNDNTVL